MNRGVVLVLSILLHGCATEQSVLDLADKTSANVGIVSATLRQLSDESSRLYANRADNIVRLSAVTATHRANYAYDIALTKKVGQKAELELIDELKVWVKEVDGIYAAALNAERDRKAALLEQQTKIDTKTEAMQRLAQTLSTLAKRDSSTDRLKFMKSFAKELRDDVKKQLDDGTETAARAKALLDQVKSSSASPIVRE